MSERRNGRRENRGILTRIAEFEGEVRPMRWRMSVHDMNRVKLCELYDSELKPEGQAYGLKLTTEISGWKELSFSLPQTVNGRRNHRWDYIRSGYLVRLERDGRPDWFL